MRPRWPLIHLVIVIDFLPVVIASSNRRIHSLTWAFSPNFPISCPRRNCKSSPARLRASSKLSKSLVLPSLSAQAAHESSSYVVCEIRQFLQNSIGKKRRLPRTKNVMSPSPLGLHVRLLNSIAKFLCETCLAYVVIVFICVKFISSCNRKAFAATNLTRWIAASLTFRLVNMHSQISSWGPSSSFKEENNNWFLNGAFILVDEKEDKYPVAIRQVPGDGSCLFHAVAAGLLCRQMMENNITAVVPDSFDVSDLSRDPTAFPNMRQLHPTMSEILNSSSKLRQRAVDTLQHSLNEQSLLYLHTNQTISASELIKSATQQYDGLTATEYLKDMRQYGVWGGGPEIVALANALGRQIILLEPWDDDVGVEEKHLSACALNSERIDHSTACLKVAAQVGKRRDVNEGSGVRVDSTLSGDIFILLANQEFPHMFGKKNAGIDYNSRNHFLAVFPVAD
mmetsp:Transcript_13281/g.25924  ORF Transcript_13281/g.25924 Transcript_13281/m.25924 type:complete len:453 (+) Transcript_13281:121-1479(+)